MRLRRGAFSLALILGSVNAGCVNYRPPPAPVAATVAGQAPSRVWTARAGRGFTAPVQVWDNILYGGSPDRKVYAVDLTDGEIRWSFRMPGMIVGGVLLAGDTVFAASSRPQGRVSALRRTNGKQIWRTSTPTVGAPLALINGVLVAETQRGEVLGLDPARGKIRWRQRVGVARTAAVPVGESEMLVATTDSLFRLDSKEGKVVARAGSPGAIVSPWVSYQGSLVAGTTDSQLVSLQVEPLRAAWSLKVDAPVLGSPATLGDTLFLVTRIGTLYRMDPGSEPRLRRITSLDWPVTSPVTIEDGTIILGGADGLIRALRTDGRELWRVRVWRPVEVGPVGLRDGLVALGGNGDLHRYRQ